MVEKKTQIRRLQQKITARHVRNIETKHLKGEQKKNKQKNNLNEILYYIVIVRSQKRRI